MENLRSRFDGVLWLAASKLNAADLEPLREQLDASILKLLTNEQLENWYEELGRPFPTPKRPQLGGRFNR